MNDDKAEAIAYLKSAIADYRRQLAVLPANPAGKPAEIADAQAQRQRLSGLLEDARRLLAQLEGPGSGGR